MKRLLFPVKKALFERFGLFENQIPRDYSASLLDLTSGFTWTSTKNTAAGKSIQ